MHAFIDAFVIGEGEEVIQDIINTIQRFKSSKVSTFKREDLLIALAQISGVYVPRFYEAAYLEDGRLPIPSRSFPKRQKW